MRKAVYYIGNKGGQGSKEVAIVSLETGIRLKHSLWDLFVVG